MYNLFAIFKYTVTIDIEKNMIQSIVSSIYFQFSAGIASLFSFIISILVFYNIRELNKKYYLKARLPDVRRRLTRYATQIIRCFPQGYIDEDLANRDMEVLLKQSRSVIQNLRANLPGEEARKAEVVEMMYYNNCVYLWRKESHITYGLAFNIYVGMQELIEALNLLEKDLKYK